MDFIKVVGLATGVSLGAVQVGLADGAVGLPYDQAPGFAQSFVRNAGIDAGLVADNGVYVFTGDATGDGVDDALVMVYYFEQNSVDIVSQIFRGEGGAMVPVGTLNVAGQEPRDFSVGEGAFRLTATVAGPNDPRCCPTQPQTYLIPFPK